jgi:citrate synthase
VEDKLYMTAEEAAQALGVNVATIYAYVTRKILRAYRPPGVRSSKYWRVDVERIRSKAPPAGRDADPLVSQTQITAITESGPFYRGRSAVELAETETIEAVAALLWRADESAVFPDQAPKSSRLIERFWRSAEGLTSVDKALAVFPLIERENPRAYDLSPAGFARTGGEAMRWYATILVGAERPTAEPLHVVVARGARNQEAMQDIARRLLVLSADHELDPTTYAVRALANVGINPYRFLLTGLMASAGRRLPFSQPDSVNRFMDDLGRADDPKDAVVARLRVGETIPGFGSDLYPKGDPRAAALLKAMSDSLYDDPDLQRLNKAIEVMRELTGLEPALGLVNNLVGRKLGANAQDGNRLRLGRMAGWIAHAMEQYLENEMVRPHAAYVGLLPSQLGAGGGLDGRPSGSAEATSGRRRSSRRPG